MFGLIGHLTNLSHAQRVARDLGYDEYACQDLEFWCMAPPQAVDEITITSVTGQVIHGQYVESCFLPEMLAQGKFKTAMRKVLNAMALVQKRGIDITALGGFSSIIFENFSLEKLLNVRDITLDIRRFTTGNTHTAYILSQQVEQGAARYGIDLHRATVAVVGATGDIGSGVCRWLTRHSGPKELLLVARDYERLERLQQELGSGTILPVEEALSRADIVVWVASLNQGMAIDPATLRTPCLLIDGGYPKNMAGALQRPGVYVLDGGMVEHSLDIDWKIMSFLNVPNPARQFFACFAESMLLEFEGLHFNFSWGRNYITVEKMEQIGSLSRKHGFRPLLEISGAGSEPVIQ
ncbi:long-chain acyl-[acyl-carrier-protein] reductase [Gloeobacter kilaueensis]|uniref:Long-chain acyl-[acyl-carrier-protein] reductase n=1 Tax=Gloeobacter kilaueensis (strain ATCC BAA-2537 / CCAP 1431/1 / ULC 316 / JS1) TaxID=1183438 RepID=U5QDG7_GLOK1|nr:long-chain acyl-[acyl-carrier-protein] reductase [Gloeobacter kilaueensis]AGY56972.1 fatty aldehyde-generating acyl-ACP reductase [Gloeobacter kilaueensis JS1]